MKKVRYTGCSDAQATCGKSHDSRGVLVVGANYEVEREEVHRWHTLLHLKGFSGTPFNSVCFEDMREEE